MVEKCEGRRYVLLSDCVHFGMCDKMGGLNFRFWLGFYALKIVIFKNLVDHRGGGKLSGCINILECWLVRWRGHWCGSRYKG